MLQNPSKYHPNPLSHFLALHNSANHHHHQQQHQQQQQQQQHHQQNPNHQIHHNVLGGGNHHLNNTTGMVNTSLDVGKSFTIAAILGLQKNAIEHHHHHHHHNTQRDFNSVMNLSLNDHQTQNLKNNLNIINNNNSSDNNSIASNIKTSSSNNNNSNNHTNNNNNNSVGISVKGFDCDSVVSRYLPNSNGGVGSNSGNNAGGNVTAVVNAGHLRIASNHFGNVVNSTNTTTPSALQSLQQLHQQHAQQQAAAANLGYQRDKIKNDHITAKKSSLKSKRVRTIFTPEQLERLEAEFERQQYMVGPERLYLAHTLQLTEAQVKVWFQNRRIKWRKHHLEITQQRLALIRQTQIANGDENSAAGNLILNTTNNPSVCGDGNNDILNNNDCQLVMTPPPTNQNNQSESDLSICNDSIDGESIIDGDD